MTKKLLFALVIGFLLSITNLWSQKRTQVLVVTNKGKFVVELFDETPLHKEAFLSNVRAGKYEGTQFHRVIKNFMVQGGHPLTKGLKYEEELPEDTISGTVKPEFMSDLFVHERGVLAAARQGDEVNPQRLSSASQFYIVTGKYYTAYDLEKESAKHGVVYNEEQRKAYMLRGGAAHLDGTYTIYGRLLGDKDFKTIDKIQRVDTDGDDRPLKPVVIISMTILP